MVRSIVLKLEENFNDIDKKMQTVPYFDGTWKTLALENTIREIPRIPISGVETGVFSGLGTHLYVNKDEFDMSKTVRWYCFCFCAIHFFSLDACILTYRFRKD